MIFKVIFTRNTSIIVLFLETNSIDSGMNSVAYVDKDIQIRQSSGRYNFKNNLAFVYIPRIRI